MNGEEAQDRPAQCGERVSEHLHQLLFKILASSFLFFLAGAELRTG